MLNINGACVRLLVALKLCKDLIITYNHGAFYFVFLLFIFDIFVYIYGEV